MPIQETVRGKVVEIRNGGLIKTEYKWRGRTYEFNFTLPKGASGKPQVDLINYGYTLGEELEYRVNEGVQGEPIVVSVTRNIRQ